MKADEELTLSSGGGVDYPFIETSFFLMYMAGQFSIGFLSSKLSTKSYLLFSVLGSATCCLLFGFTSSTSPMAALWGLNGFSQSAVNTLLVNFLAGVVPAPLRGSIL